MNGSDGWSLIEATVFDTVGCTEPVAIALAATKAAKALGGDITEVKIVLSANVFKNAMAVGIPGSSRKGIRYAVALGLFKGEPDLGLALLANIRDSDTRGAVELMDRVPMEISLAEAERGVYIAVELQSAMGRAEIVVSGSHDQVRSLKVNGKETLDPQGTGGDSREGDATGNIPALLQELREMEMVDIVALAESIPLEQCKELEEGVSINLAAAARGMETRAGMGLGAALRDMMEDGSLGKGLAEEVKSFAAAGADARMGGELIPVKGCGGSGNHGIAFFITLGMTLRRMEERLVKEPSRALALGLLLVQYIKSYTGLLTPICGVTVCASAAAAAGIVYALGGTPEQMFSAVQLVDGNIAGILCDGAKHGCSLKVATSAGTGVEAALAALSGVTIPKTDGIVGATLKESLVNIRKLQDDGMEAADRTMLALLLEKEKSGLFSC